MSSLVCRLVVSAVVLLPALALGRGIGTDYYLVSPEGKLLWEHKWDRLDHVAVGDQLVFQVRGDRLTATRFGAKEPVWSVKAPASEEDLRAAGGAEWQNRPGVVALFTRTAVHAFDTRNGTAKYTYALDKYDAARREGLLGRMWPGAPGSDPTSLRHRYLTTRTGPAGFAKFDVEAGKVLWERALPAGEGKRINAMSAGVVGIASEDGRQEYLLFDDESGRLLDKIPVPADAPPRVLSDGGMVFTLAPGKDGATALTAFDCRTQESRWSVTLPAGVKGFVGGQAHGRLLCASEKELFIIDTARKAVLSRVPLSGTGGPSALQWEGAVVVAEGTFLRSVAPATGAVNWTVAGFPAREAHWSVSLPHPKLESPDRFAVVSPQSVGERAPWVLELRSLKDGGPVWRWAVPERFHDMTSVRVHACAAGWLVERGWIVLD